MSDDRTAEQKEADANLDEAIRRTAQAHGRIGPDHVMTDWIVLGAGIGMAEDGGNTTLGFHLMPEDGNHLDWHRTLGMLRAAQLRLEDAYLRDDG